MGFLIIDALPSAYSDDVGHLIRLKWDTNPIDLGHLIRLKWDTNPIDLGHQPDGTHTRPRVR